MKIRVVFANIFQGFIFAGKDPSEQIAYRFSPLEYVEYFKKLKPDILAISEMLVGDDAHSSEMLKLFSKKLKLQHTCMHTNDRSWLYPGMYYGSAVLTKFPIMHKDFFPLPNPKLEIDRPDGSHWVMHDKVTQQLLLRLKKNIQLNFFNLSYHPFHHFQRSLAEPEFEEMRWALARSLIPKNSYPSIVTGDFFNRGIKFFKAFPEIAEIGGYKQAVEVETTYVGMKDQVDHVLYNPGKGKLMPTAGGAQRNYSDHYALIVDFEIE